ncbi:hypothetical protein OL548_19545 [Lysinibacillus sp. MHQ-1]|nr:hypothetical protein OL548_19545 [Lysinibacillus sp. MHQ-1]
MLQKDEFYNEKNIIFSMLFILLISEGTVFALDNSLSIDEEFITKKSCHRGYSKDWSYFDTPENF